MQTLKNDRRVLISSLDSTLRNLEPCYPQQVSELRISLNLRLDYICDLEPLMMQQEVRRRILAKRHSGGSGWLKGAGPTDLSKPLEQRTLPGVTIPKISVEQALERINVLLREQQLSLGGLRRAYYELQRSLIANTALPHARLYAMQVTFFIQRMEALPRTYQSTY